LDVNDVLKNIFFNVRTGEFIGNHQAMASLLYINKKITEKIAEEKEKKIQELTDSIKRQ